MNEQTIAENTVIVTNTGYSMSKETLESDFCRTDLAKRMLKEAKDRGYRTVVVDCGTPAEMQKEFEPFCTEFFASTKPFGAARREAIKKAYALGAKVIAWTEPEKVTYIPELWKTAKPVLCGESAFVVPKRSSLDSYPLFQQHTESAGNIFWKELTSTELDVFFAPRTWEREMSKYFLSYNGEYGDKWDSIFVPLLDAAFNKEKIISISVDYVNPREQTEIEEKNAIAFYRKRIDQLVHIIKSLEMRWQELKLRGRE